MPPTVHDPSGARVGSAVGLSPPGIIVAIQRLRRPPHPVTFTRGAITLYEVELSAAPSAAWRAGQHTPTLGRRSSTGPASPSGPFRSDFTGGSAGSTPG